MKDKVKNIECSTHCVHAKKKCEVCKIETFLKCMADYTRLKILFSLIDGEKCVGDIQSAIDESQSLVSHQLRVLKQNDLVKSTKVGNKAYYTLADNHVVTILTFAKEHINER